MKRYSPKDIESKWQKYWDDNGTYVADLESDKPKYYGFAMFNYPSGSSIHLGHAKNFTIPDILLRYKRQKGFEAFAPVGFDSFGLPAENFAIKTGTPPRETTDKAIESYRKQYKAMGWGVDWSREIDSSMVDYYKWTQWCFNQLYKDGLAYQKDSAQWWCSQCKTVLADEQVFSGKCWRHDGEDDPLVTKKTLHQWFFKITDYADDILEATDDLNWTPWVKTAQKNWIGRKSGIEIIYRIDGIEGEDENIICFTTRPDTNFGATFVVIAPEHPFAQRVASGDIEPLDGDSRAANVKKYIDQAAAKSELDRQKDGRKKTGAFTGFYAHNGLNGRKMPIWISDFVLAGFGTGAVVGVPGHDLRDFEFAQAFDIPIIRVVVGSDGDDSEITEPEQVQEKIGTMVNSEFLNDMDIHAATEKMMDHMEEHGMGIKVVNYSVRDWLISRQRYWGAPIPIIHCQGNCGAVAVPDEQLPVALPVIDDYHPDGEGKSPLAKVTDWVNTPCPECGGPGVRETDTMDGYVCSSWYPMRYLSANDSVQAWDPELAKKWMPVNFYNGGDHATAHLLYARFFTRFFYNKGLVGNPEPFERMYFHAKILAPDGTFFSKSKGNGINPLEVIDSGYGADALRTYIMFIAPPDVESPWNNDGLPSIYRFLNRIWVLVQEHGERGENVTGDQSSQILKSVHKAIQKVTNDIEAIKFNTAISAMMTCVNDLYKFKEQDSYGSSAWNEALDDLVQLVAPFAPHMAEELWRDLGHEDSVHIDHWPELDEDHLVEDVIKLAVQVNGKVRAEIEVAADASEESIKDLALSQENVKNHVGDSEPKKVIYVSGRLVSVVV